MKHLPLATLLLLAPGLAAQEVRPRSGLESGPNAPAASSQLPPSIPPGNSQPGPRDTPMPSRDGRTGGDTPRSSGPPADHRVLGGPPVPGARQPEHSEGIVTNRDVIPPNVADTVRPNGSTTGSGR